MVNGVSMADVNGDGLLDIYVCNSGNEKGEHKENELYINNGLAGDKVSFSKKQKNMGSMTKAILLTLLFLTTIEMVTWICIS
jgi:hypothetical protein